MGKIITKASKGHRMAKKGPFVTSATFSVRIPCAEGFTTVVGFRVDRHKGKGINSVRAWKRSDYSHLLKKMDPSTPLICDKDHDGVLTVGDIRKKMGMQNERINKKIRPFKEVPVLLH